MAASVVEWPRNLSHVPSQPPVTIITPTYNRRRFLPALMECIKSQTYPNERMEWLVFDDGTDRVEDVLAPHKDKLNIRYISSDTKLNIGAKRNRLHELARGDIVVVMDDDDYYPPERVAHAVHTLLSKKVQICGSTVNHLYFTDDKSIWRVGPYNPNHGTFGTMAYTATYARTHKCDESKTYAEEVEFTNSYKEPFAQLDPMKVMLVMCHSENTFSKTKFRESTSPVVKRTDMKLKNWIRTAKQREFYASA